MEITVKVTREELQEMGVNRDELKVLVIEDLDYGRDYVGFNVHVEIVE